MKEEKMLKVTAGLVLSTFAVCLPLTVFADPKPAPPLPRILVTYQVLEVPGDTPVSVSDTQPASEVYKILLQTPGAEATEISLQIPADFPGTAQYNRVLTFSAQYHGKPTHSFLDVPTSLQATPHINPDGTITVQLKTEVTRAASAIDDEVPLTNSESWQSKQTFKSGETRMFGSTVRVTPDDKSGTMPQNKELLEFVTVTILPNEKTAQR